MRRICACQQTAPGLQSAARIRR